MTYTKNQR